MSYTIDTTTAAASVIAPSGNATKVVLESRLPSWQEGQETTVDTYAGPRAAVLEMYEDYKGRAGVLSIDPQDRPAGCLALVITWGAGPSDIETITGELPTWRVEDIRIQAPLASHPYFQQSAAMPAEIAAADFAITRGLPYVATGALKDYMKRYYGLRKAQVQSYEPAGVVITKTWNTTLGSDLDTAHEKTGLVVSLDQITGLPPDLKGALKKLPKITSYTSADPTTYQLNENGAEWEFVQQRPEVEGPDDGPWTLRVRWVGLDQWSTVLYPGGSWDPVGATA